MAHFPENVSFDELFGLNDIINELVFSRYFNFYFERGRERERYVPTLIEL